MIGKRKLIIAGVCLLTLLNSGAVAYGFSKHRQSPAQTQTKAAPTIKSSKVVKADASKVGVQQGEGKYAFESLASSKQADGEIGRLSLITSPSGVNFVSALASDTKLDGKLNAGWTTKDLAVDRLWEPGGCASKPTYFIQGRYIFIDDGKNQPTDKYSSYIIYDITTGKYDYFGGSDFTDQQGQKERILKVADENDQPVFYIDVPDVKGALAGSATFKHARGSEAGYIIRRVINPSDLTYQDYKLPYSLPADASYYFTEFYGSAGPLFTVDGSGKQYQGTISNNQISIAPYQDKIVTTVDASGLEKQLSPLLDQKLPSFLEQNDGPKPASDFQITSLGSSGPLQMLMATATLSTSATPVIYNSNDHSLDIATSQSILSFSNFVPLGVY